MITRRSFLRGAGGAGLALPLLGGLACAPGGRRTGSTRRALDGHPLRFVVCYMPNGNIERELPAADAGWDAYFAPGALLEPLQPFASKLMMLRGLDMSVVEQGAGEPHQQGMAFLTGLPLNHGNMLGGDQKVAGWASGPSIDQVIANAIGRATRYKSLHFGVQSAVYGGTEVRTVISYEGENRPIANEASPWAMFARVFAELDDPAAEKELRLGRRLHVVDKAARRFASLAPRLGAEDRLKLEQHLAALRDVETRLGSPGGELGVGGCRMPRLAPAESPVDPDNPSHFPMISGLQMELLSLALACDLTRVATLQWSASTNNRPYPWLLYDEGGGAGLQPISGDEHALGHAPDEDVHAWAKLGVIRRWYMSELAWLLGRMDSIPEGEGTLLDHTVVVLGSEISYGNTHSHVNAPFLMAGSAGGWFRTGQAASVAGRYHNDLLVSLQNAMGIEDGSFGHPDFCTGPLPGIT